MERRCLVVLLALFLAAAGCNRTFYRDNVDREVNDILREKDQFPAWKIDQFHVYPDPRARFADEGRPDRPPMPPDDPATADVSPVPQKPPHAGVKLMEGGGYLEMLAAWDAENREANKDKTDQKSRYIPGGLPDVVGESPYPDPLTTKKPPKAFLLRQEQAVILGLVNSREFQDRREDLYLTALPVSVERFAFSSQFFAAAQVTRRRIGKFLPDGPSNSWLVDSNVGVSKLFSTGALLLAQFANNTVIEMVGSGTPRTTSVSNINLDIIQPLLQGGGRAITLEPLTLVERNLLYEIRDFARFRKQFFVAVAAGGDIGGITVGATRFRNRPATFTSGNAIPGAQISISRGGTIGLPTSTPSSSPTGFLPNLLNDALLDNERNNVEALERILQLYQAYLEGGRVSQLEVAQVEQQLLDSRQRVFGRAQDLQEAIDRFKLQLGLPVATGLELDDEPLSPVSQQLRLFERLIDDYDTARKEVTALAALPEPARLRAEMRKLARESRLVKDVPFRTDFSRRWGIWEKRTDEEINRRLELNGEELRRLRSRRDDLLGKEQEPPPELLAQIADVEYEIELGLFEQSLRAFEKLPAVRPIGPRVATVVGAAAVDPLSALVPAAVAQPDAPAALPPEMFRPVLSRFADLLLRARDQRVALVREKWPRIPALCVSGVDLLKADLTDAEAEVARVALTNRFDLMNTRAQLVDSWRQIALAANSLLGVFNVEYHLNSVTPAGLARPFDFDGSRTRHRLVLNGQLPLTRILERNSYRAALIGWQRQRRTVMATEDSTAAAVRLQLRSLRVLAETYRIQQRAVELGYLRVELALDTLQAPPLPGATGDSLALTRELLQALSSLVGAQNDLITTWINYLTARMQLYRDLELINLDERGVWIDDVATCQCPPEHSTDQSRPGQPQGQ